ncbi:MAG: rod shape-determining protein MreC [Rhodothermaceae bacterium]|nr:rod shape-determining protein MreC [Rhodothermaceae bacterium]MYF63760.1 rod shape-determining protein MreC [Rhodothermaceae bacterium]MYI84168.1 rod shape-determining protein MreC [Rhodothermaceae bacterium]
MIDLWYRLRDYALLSALLIISLIFMTNANQPLMRGIRSQALQIAGKVEYRMAWAAMALRAFNENQALRDAHRGLTSELARLRVVDIENQVLRQALDWKNNSDLETVAARIVAREPFGTTNFFTLDVGSVDGIEVNMAVVSHLGILGRVIDVSRNYSTVLPHLHSQFHVPAMIDTLRVIGIISGEGNEPDVLELKEIVVSADVQNGQRVVTHEASGIFPPNMPIGTILESNRQAGSNYWQIKVTPAAPLSTAHFAFVILNRPDSAGILLESLSNN